jgi:hypothetical protein
MIRRQAIWHFGILVDNGDFARWMMGNMLYSSQAVESDM